MNKSNFIAFTVLALALVNCGKKDAETPAAVDPGTTTFTVTAPGSSSYTINGAANPSLTLKRLQTYTFNVNAPGHPFYLMSVQGTNVSNAFSNGVTGNGATSGAITFVVPAAAPSTLFYNCSVHAAMTGTITVTD